MKKWIFLLFFIFTTILTFSLSHSTKFKLLLLKIRYESAYTQLRDDNKQFKQELKDFKEQIVALQKSGKTVSCSYQIYREVRWRIDFTRDSNEIKKRLVDLKNSLNSDQQIGDEQDLKDGSYGACFSEWFLKVWSTHEHLDKKTTYKYPFHVLDLINSPERLRNYLNEVMNTNFLQKNELTRVRADDSLSAIGYMIMSGEPKGYPWHPGIKKAYIDFLDEVQDPNTGMWGITFDLGFGIKVKVPDTGITFHILGQRKCDVKRLDKLARGMLSLKDINFPFGWKVDGHYENHMNMDAARNFRCAWTYTDESSRKLIIKEMQKELDWSLKNSLNASGEFKLSELDETLGDAYENGIGFLREVGYFDRAKKFWTTKEFFDANIIKEKIKQSIQKIGTQDAGMRNALHMLDEMN